jgi:hypothetical protein
VTEPQFFLTITPEPAPDERDAIVAALLALASSQSEVAQPKISESRWRAAAKQEMLRAPLPRDHRQKGQTRWKPVPVPATSE